jgi:Zn finger protein HypA/HybF involved in hydrogenase expression
MATTPPPNRSAESTSLEGDFLRCVNRRLDFQCAGCGYGAVSAAAPLRCPMCGGDTWDMATPRRLFDRRLQ